MHGVGKSDGRIVPKKPPNKDGLPTSAEAVEGRRPTEGNTLPQAASRTQSRIDVSSGLQRVREVARKDKRARFTALLHHVTVDLLRDSFYALKRQAAPGVDGVTWQQYEVGLEDRLADLHRRVHAGTYRAQPSKRALHPEGRRAEASVGHRGPGGQGRPARRGDGPQPDLRGRFPGLLLRVPPGRGPHDALDALWVGIMGKKVNWVLDADIQGFFDTICHGMAGQVPRAPDRRPKDPPPDPEMAEGGRVRGRSVVEDGSGHAARGGGFTAARERVSCTTSSTCGFSSGGRKSATGEVIVVRYADDFVVGFQHRHEAERFLRELAGTVGEVRPGLAPREDAADRVRAVRRRDRRQRGSGQAGDVRLPGLHPLLWAEASERGFLREAEDA